MIVWERETGKGGGDRGWVPSERLDMKVGRMKEVTM